VYAVLAQVSLASLIDLNGRPSYFHTGWFLISVANAIVIGLMVVAFVLAVLVPFPHDEVDE